MAPKVFEVFQRASGVVDELAWLSGAAPTILLGDDAWVPFPRTAPEVERYLAAIRAMHEDAADIFDEYSCPPELVDAFAVGYAIASAIDAVFSVDISTSYPHAEIPPWIAAATYRRFVARCLGWALDDRRLGEPDFMHLTWVSRHACV